MILKKYFILELNYLSNGVDALACVMVLTCCPPEKARSV